MCEFHKLKQDTSEGYFPTSSDKPLSGLNFWHDLLSFMDGFLG
jgi:hypothetical protein